MDAGAGRSLGQLPRNVDERGRVELPAAGRLPRVDVPGCERSILGVLLDAGAEIGASGRVIFQGHESQAPRFPE